MPIRNIPGGDIAYYLILFDENGHEREEADGTMLSAAVMARLAAADDPITDVFVCSHGWQGDVPAAIDQYDRWIGAMAQCEADVAAMEARNPAFNPMVIGVHWPSLPWGMETVPAAAASTPAGGVLAPGAGAAHNDAIDTLAAQLDADATARDALQRIFAFADEANGTNLPGAVLADFETLFASSKLRTGSSAGRPGADQDGFDPQAIVDAIATPAGATPSPAASAAQPHVLGIVSAVKDAVLAPLRQLSFWKMKDRARTFGEGGAHALLGAMQNASATARFHLMGHSFGCIVVSGMIAGESTTSAASVAPALHRPVDSLFLVQGALSLWSFAADVPFAPGTPGYFSRILDAALICGPLLTTRSSWDTAVGKFYPLGAATKGQFLLGTDAFPKYGGVGAFGIQGAPETVPLTLGALDTQYDFSDGHVFNFDASGVIRNGTGPAGAHSDIAHPEVAHAFWSAALAGASANTAGTAHRGVDDDEPIAPPAAHAPARAEPPRRGLLDIEETLPASAGVESVQRGGLLGIDDAPAADPAADGAASRGGGSPTASPTASPPPPPAAASAAAPGSAPQPPSTARWINAEFEDKDPADPLVKGQWHTLAFGVDVSEHQDAVARVEFLERGVFGPGDEAIVLTVQIDTDDFDLSGHTGLMRVPPTGKGYSKARFDIAARKDGPCVLKATILKEGQFIQQIDLTFDVGSAAAPAVQVATRGRGLDGLAVLQPRDLSLQIYPGAAGDYECVLCGAVATHVRLPVNAALIDAYIRSARDSLMKVVMYRDAGGNYVFQSGIDVPQTALNDALPIMADAGALLLSTLFYGPGAGDDVRAVGNALRQLGTRPDLRLKIQIVAQTLPVPWPLLYLGDVSGDVPYSWDNFLGMRHIIEQIPLQNPMAVTEPEITSAPSLNVSLNFHAGIDAQMGVDVVASQRAFWQGRAGTTIEDRENGDDFIKALRQAQTPDQILYLYCHAVSKGLTDPGGPGASSIELTDRLISLNDLKLRAPTDTRLAGKPLVFINACESAEMSSTFYDGFAPYFMDKGARGVIGTECKTPALFAKAWADRFFEEFLAGEALGNVMLGLRDEFLKAHRNPLGLLYAVHCDADTRIDPALQTSQAPPAASADGTSHGPGDAVAPAAGAAG